jgi:hypothetical protein
LYSFGSMFSFLKKVKKKSPSRSIVIPSIGILHYLTWPEESFWMGDVNTIVPNEIELRIETYNNSDPTEVQIELIQQLPSDCPYYMDICYAYLDEAYEKFSLEEIKKMYFLAAIELGRGNNRLTFTLEAYPFVNHKYDHFKYFTIVDKIITSATIG